MFSSLFWFFLLQTPTTAIEGKGAPKVTVPRIEAAVEIDGRLDEAPWEQAVRLGGFSQYQPSDGRPAEERTEVLVWYSPEAIHFGIIAHDRDPSSVRATQADRDNIDRDDNVTIYLDTFNDRRRAFFFAVNPLGSQQDGVQSEGQFSAGTMFGGTVDKSPDYRFDSKGQLTDEGYVVELRIPFKSLRYPGSGPQQWGLNVKRKIQRTGYEDTWTDARRVASFLAQAGTIDGLHDMKRGVVTELQPFVTATSAGERRPDRTFARDEDASGGANLRFGFTNLSLDATINPDFSQVESDAGLITINQRFALFFAEKRPFFLEGIELFSTPNQLVYTRQIVDPITGGKLTGKFGPYGVAHLTAIDDVQGGDNALFNVTRLRRDFGQNSVAGVTLTDRTAGGAFNRVLAADTRIVFKRLYYVLGQIGGSWTGDGVSRSAPIWTMEFDRTARRWGFNYKLNGIGEGFESRAGFVNRTNIVEARAFNRFTYYGARGAMLETASVFLGPSRIWRYHGFGRESPTEGGENVNLTANLRGGWQLQGRLSREFVKFDPAMYSRYTVLRDGVPVPYAAPEELDGVYGTTASVTTPTWQKLNARVEIVRTGTAIFPEAAEGHERRWSLTLGLRPTSSMRVDFTSVRSTIRRSRDDSEFARTTLPRLRIEYQPLRSLFFRVVGEYRDQRQAALLHAVTGEPIFIGDRLAARQEQSGLRLDWLASFEPIPGTSAYFGYGSALDSPGRFDWRDLNRVNDGFFLKLAYQIRR